jgi:hypothetical protein
MSFGDITLEEDKVSVNSRWLHVNSWDIMLDGPGRRREEGTPYRRALVHDGEDGLTINYNMDYPGGVTLCGSVSLPETLNVAGNATFEQKPTVPDILLTELPVFRLDGDLVDGPDIPGRPTIPGIPGIPVRRRRRRSLRPVREPGSLVDIIKAMQEKIRTLEERIETLEDRP